MIIDSTTQNVAIIGGILLLTVVLVILIGLWPRWTQRRALRTQAQQDFLNARGAVHQKLLNDALSRIETQKTLYTNKLTDAKKEKLDQERLLDAELSAAYAQWVIQKHFHEVPGIGPKLREQIIGQIFKRYLADLSNAHFLAGVGETRQSAISSWVKKYEDKKPELFKIGIPGQEDIERTFRPSIQMEEYKINLFSQELFALNDCAIAVRLALTSLNQVSEADFVEAFLHPENHNDKVAAYLRGVYEEWEPMPAWFREALEVHS